MKDKSRLGFIERLFLKCVRQVYYKVQKDKKKQYDRFLPFADYLVERSERAQLYGFDEGSTVYDNVLIFGHVNVGKHTWIGSNVILDGSGELTIGSYCSISTGVQIYSHDSIKWAVSGGVEPYEYAATYIEDNCYIGPNVIITKGVRIGRGSIIGANSFVNRDIPTGSKAFGNPAVLKI